MTTLMCVDMDMGGFFLISGFQFIRFFFVSQAGYERTHVNT